MDINWRVRAFLNGAMKNNSGVGIDDADLAKIPPAQLLAADTELATLGQVGTSEQAEGDFFYTMGALCDEGYTLLNNNGDALLAYKLWEGFL